MNDSIMEVVGPILALIGMIIGVPLYIWGAIKSIKALNDKKYLSLIFWKLSRSFSGMGCVLWILFGWWAALIVLSTGLNILFWTIPFIWIIDKYIPSRNICPSCKANIRGDISRCPYCTGEVIPIFNTQ